jgi:hypothetical protein
MAPDIIDLLRRGAHVPDDEPDVDRLWRRARQLRRRRRTNLALVGLLVLLLVPIGMAGRGYFQDRSPSEVGQPPTQGQPPAPRPSPSKAPNSVVPAARIQDGNAVMPVAFLDGTTAEVVYPKALDLAGLGVRPGGSAELPGCCARDFFFPPGGESWFAAAGPPLKQFVGADGRLVVLWPGRSNDVGRYLVFHLGSWWMGVWDQAGGSTMTDEQLAVWATHLRGRQTPDGFLVLQAIPPLRLAGPGPGATAPRLEFGNQDGRSVTLTVEPCEAPTQRSADGARHYAKACHPEWSISVQVQGDRHFVEAVLNGLQVRNVSVARQP